MPVSLGFNLSSKEVVALVRPISRNQLVGHRERLVYTQREKVKDTVSEGKVTEFMNGGIQSRGTGLSLIMKRHIPAEIDMNYSCGRGSWGYLVALVIWVK
jgi:hypothetical protein